MTDIFRIGGVPPILDQARVKNMVFEAWREDLGADDQGTCFEIHHHLASVILRPDSRGKESSSEEEKQSYLAMALIVSIAFHSV